MCVNETYSKVWEDKHLCDMLPIDMVGNKEMLYGHWFSTSLLWYVLGAGFGKLGWLEIKWYTSAVGLC